MPSQDSFPNNRLRDLPKEFFPREKLIELGADSLSNAELIALFLRTGVKGKNVLDVSMELLRSAGSLAALSSMDCRQISTMVKGIGLAKAATLAAAFELGGRALRETVRDEPMNDPSKVYEYLSSRTSHLVQEKIFVLVLDVKMKLIVCKEISHGILDESVTHPREVLRPVIVNNGYAFILAHNHPSGDPKPSHSDNHLTESIHEAAMVMGINFMDHIIMGRPSPLRDHPFYSYRRNKWFDGRSHHISTTCPS